MPQTKTRRESMPASAGSALMRARAKKKAKAAKNYKVAMGCESKRSLHEAVSGVIEAVAAAAPAAGHAPEGPIVKVVLLTEGLGNVRDKNYYGPEAVASMPAMFEGAVCMVDHPSYSEEQDIPEGRVNKTVGYYKRLRVETIQTADGPRTACVGELHFDVSEDGRRAYEKACTAVHYGSEFPGSGKEYVGLSINAYGESEPRQMMVDGQDTEVNYVLRFVEVRSCDMVTIPARGGKFVALVESIAGARPENKEVRTMFLKNLHEAQKALKEAQAEKDEATRVKKMGEALKAIAAIEAEMVKAGVIKKSAEGKKGKEDEAENEAEGEGEAENEADADMEDGDSADAGDDGDDDSAGADADDSHTTVTHKIVKKTGKAALAKNEGERRAHRMAVKALVKESGLAAQHFDMDELFSMSFVEAEREIKRTKRVSEANAAMFIRRYGADLGAGNFSKIQEAAGGAARSAGDLFPELPA